MIIIGIILVIILFWAIKSGQFDDLEGDAHRILMDEDLIPEKKKDDSLLRDAEGSSLKHAEGTSLKHAEGSSLKTAEGSSPNTAEGSTSEVQNKENSSL